VRSQQRAPGMTHRRPKTHVRPPLATPGPARAEDVGQLLRHGGLLRDVDRLDCRRHRLPPTPSLAGEPGREGRHAFARGTRGSPCDREGGRAAWVVAAPTGDSRQRGAGFGLNPARQLLGLSRVRVGLRASSLPHKIFTATKARQRSKADQLFCFAVFTERTKSGQASARFSMCAEYFTKENSFAVFPC